MSTAWHLALELQARKKGVGADLLVLDKTGGGKLVAGELMGDRSTLLEPFRFARYASGDLHPVSASPFPWS